MKEEKVLESEREKSVRLWKKRRTREKSVRKCSKVRRCKEK